MNELPLPLSWKAGDSKKKEKTMLANPNPDETGTFCIVCLEELGDCSCELIVQERNDEDEEEE